MKILRRILATILVIVAALCWIGPAGVLYFVKTAPAVTRLVPTEPKDLSISQALGKKVSYFGYELEVPWSDLDESQTRVFPENNHDRQMAWICFRSGLKLFIVITPLETRFPEYEFLKSAYAVTPDKIHYWSLIQGWGYRDARFLLIKSTFLRGIGRSEGESSPAETGIFNLHSSGSNGFQYGDPRSRPDELELLIYSADSRVKIKVLQGGYDEPGGVSQPEINRIVQTLHRTSTQLAAAPN